MPQIFGCYSRRLQLCATSQAMSWHCRGAWPATGCMCASRVPHMRRQLSPADDQRQCRGAQPQHEEVAVPLPHGGRGLPLCVGQRPAAKQRTSYSSVAADRDMPPPYRLGAPSRRLLLVRAGIRCRCHVECSAICTQSNIYGYLWLAGRLMRGRMSRPERSVP